MHHRAGATEDPLPVTRSRRRLGLALGLSAGLAIAGLPAAQAGLLDTATDPVGDAVEESFAPRLVTVTADLAQRNLLANSGLDVTEHAGHDYVEVVLHTRADVELLESLGLPYQVRIADLNARTAEVQRINAAYAASTARSPLPSGRTDYRTLEDYNADMVALAKDHPEVVRLFKLPHQSVEGKDILGVEIASGQAPDTTPDEVDVIAPSTDERPTFLLMGLHHAREWPSGEHAIEFAIDLAKGYRGDLGPEEQARIRPLVDGGRTVVIPVINPDGFEKSINDGKVLDLNVIQDQDPLGGTTPLATPNNAYKRKNCRLHEALDGVPVYCDAAKSPVGYGVGVDLNRNYGALHGGPGTDTNPASPVYHGGEGFSEPETQNVRELVSDRHVTMVISNHTFSNLILRPNGVNPLTEGPDGLPIGEAPDEDAMKELGARMAAENGYANIHGWELYDTTGTTEDYTYNATGGYGYTFEIGPHEFHPPFPHVVDEYVGTGDYHGEGFTGKGNREAYLIALGAALHPSSHSIVAGRAVEGATLRLSRSGSVPTWTGSFDDLVEATLTVPAGGAFEWRTNPSTRPVVMGKRYRELGETPSATETKEGAVPAFGESVDVPWTPTADAAIVHVGLDWALPDDLDLYVYKVEGGKETQVASSGNAPGEKESVTLAEVVAGTSYIFRVENFAAVPEQPFTLTFESFTARTVTTTGLIEAWTLTCEKDGNVLAQVPVIVDRGQRTVVDLGACNGATPKRGKQSGKGKVR